jgi:hypothetical protein
VVLLDPTLLDPTVLLLAPVAGAAAEMYSQKRRPAERHACDQQERFGSEETREETREVRTVLPTSSTVFGTHVFALFPIVAAPAGPSNLRAKQKRRCE